MFLSEKKDCNFNYAQTAATAKIQVSYAAGNRLGLMINETFAKGITNTEAGVAYYKNKDLFYYEFGGGLGYQRNIINYNERTSTIFGLLSLGPYYSESMNNEYFTSFFSGCFLLGDKTFKMGLSLKANLMYISMYNVYYKEDPYLGKSQTLHPLDEEKFSFSNMYTILSEPSIVMLSKQGKNSFFRLQIGVAFASNTYAHHYTYLTNTQIVGSGTRRHPDYNNFILSMGYNFLLHSRAKSK